MNMKANKVFVKNAADREQVERAKKDEKNRRKTELEDLRVVLSMPQGRRLLWRLLGYCKVFNSIWHPSALIHHNAGKQDVGHFIMKEIMEADQEAFLKMMHENNNNEEV